MNIRGILDAFTRVASKTGRAIKGAAPEIAMVGGTVGLIVAGVIACKETPKAMKVIEKHKENLEIVAKAEEEGVTAAGETYTAEDAKHDRSMIMAQDGLQLVKTYGPAILIAVLSAASILCGGKIFRKRLTAITGAYALLEQNFGKYRQGVIEKFGKDIDQELRLGKKTELIETEVTDENGNTKKEIKEVTTVDYDGHSQYARFFDEYSREYQKDGGRNLSFITNVQREFNDRLIRQHVVFLNDVYVALGFRRTEIAQNVGWVYDPSNPNIDSYIDFGIEEVWRDRNKVKEYMTDRERTILLDFNVDGYITDKLEKFDNLI